VFSSPPKATVPGSPERCEGGKKKNERMKEIREIEVVPKELGKSPSIRKIFLVGERG